MSARDEARTGARKTVDKRAGLVWRWKVGQDFFRLSISRELDRNSNQVAPSQSPFTEPIPSPFFQTHCSKPRLSVCTPYVYLDGGIMTFQVLDFGEHSSSRGNCRSNSNQLEVSIDNTLFQELPDVNFQVPLSPFSLLHAFAPRHSGIALVLRESSNGRHGDSPRLCRQRACS